MKFTKRIAIAALAGILCAQALMPVLASGTEGNQYTGEILAAINTNYESVSSASFTTAEGGEAEAESLFSENTTQCTGDVIDNVEILNPEEAEAAAKRTAGSQSTMCLKADYEVGDTRTLHSPSYTDLSKVDLECIYTGKYCTVWYQTDGEEVTDKDKEGYISLGKDADEIIPGELELLGDVRIDTDKDGKIAINIFRMTEAGGYFSQESLVDSLGKIGSVYTVYSLTSLMSSDHIDCINVNRECYYEYQTAAVAHEYQHYINACYCYYGKTNRTYFDDIESYLDEGFSDSMSLVLTGYDREFNPSNYINDSNYSLVAHSYGNYSYNFGFGFCQYLRTRYAALTNDTTGEYPGSGIYRKVLESRNKDNCGNTLGIIADILYPADKYPELTDTDKRCRQLITDFWMACILNESSGDWGFNGDKWAEENIDFSVDYVADRLPGSAGDKILSGNASLYLINDTDKGTATVTSADDGIVFVGIDSKFFHLTYCFEDGDTWEYFGKSFETLDYGGDCPYTLSGWTTDPDFGIVEYKPGDRITIDKDTTLYPVYTDDALEIEIDKTYTFAIDDFCNSKKYFTFSVPETGYYSFNRSNGSISLFEGNDYVEDVCDDETEDGYIRTYELTEGVQYRLKAYIYDENCDFSMSFTGTERVYNLTLDAGEYGCETLTSIFNTIYTDEYKNYFPVNVKGWSLTEGSDKIDYRALSEVTLEDDMTIYAITDTELELNEGENIVPSQYNYFTFTPGSMGTYEIKVNSGYYNVYTYHRAEEDERFVSSDQYFNSNDESNTDIPAFSLEGGKTYYVDIYHENCDDPENSVITVTKISDTPQCKLIYYISFLDGNFYYDEGNVTYTIKDVPVVMQMQGEFLGWTTEKEYYDDYPLYKVGDTITIMEDTTLYPAWSEEDSDNVSVSDNVSRLIKWLNQAIWFVIRDYLSTIKNFFKVSL